MYLIHQVNTKGPVLTSEPLTQGPCILPHHNFVPSSLVIYAGADEIFKN